MSRASKQPPCPPPTSERDLLRDWELEAEVLGALILDPALLALALADGVTAAAFNRQRHRLVWEALCSLDPKDHTEGGSVAVIEALRRAGTLELAGEGTTGPAAVGNLTDWRFHNRSNAAWAWRERLLPLARARAAVSLHEGAARRIREAPDALVEIEREAARALAAIVEGCNA